MRRHGGDLREAGGCMAGSGRAGGLLPTSPFPHLPPPAFPSPAHGLAEPSLPGEPTWENKNSKPLHQGVIIHGELTLFPLKIKQEQSGEAITVSHPPRFIEI